MFENLRFTDQFDSAALYIAGRMKKTSDVSKNFRLQNKRIKKKKENRKNQILRLVVFLLVACVDIVYTVYVAVNVGSLVNAEC